MAHTRGPHKSDHAAVKISTTNAVYCIVLFFYF